MKKPCLFAIFAHPDDEAFGPAGTLIKYSKTHDVYLICATRGDAGSNNDKEDEQANLALKREKELIKSAEIIGIKKVFILDFKDGSLCNNIYHSIVGKITKITDKYKPEIFITYEQRGVSGHLDHIAVSMITHFIFHKKEYVKKMLSYVITRNMTDMMRDYFVYVPHGFKTKDADLIIDVEPYWEKKKKAVFAHKSQIKDGSNYVKDMEKAPKKEYFLVEEKI